MQKIDTWSAEYIITTNVSYDVNNELHGDKMRVSQFVYLLHVLIQTSTRDMRIKKDTN